MNPLIINAVVGIIGRIIDKKKVTSSTNVTTVAGVTAGTGAYMTLLQSDDPIMQATGAFIIFISAIATLYKERSNESDTGK